MKGIIRNVLLGILLIALSLTIYLLQVLLFHDNRDTEFYFLQDLAFIPVQVLLITVLLNRFLKLRAKREILKKMNMVIGAFFSSAGTELLSLCSRFHEEHEGLRKQLAVDSHWEDARFKETAKMVSGYTFKMKHSVHDLEALKDFLANRKDFLLGLLENPNLLEHDSFTDMLWAVFHAADELSSREDIARLPSKDCEHLEGDIRRAYGLLIYEWLYYMQHLKHDYPYLFSLASRKNPFDPAARVVIQ